MLVNNRKKLVAIIASIMMVMSIFVPAVGAEKVSAAETEAQAVSEDATITDIQIVKEPYDNTVYIHPEEEYGNEFGYDFDGMMLKLSFSDEATVEMDYFEACDVYGISMQFENVVEGECTALINFRQYDWNTDEYAVLCSREMKVKGVITDETENPDFVKIQNIEIIEEPWDNEVELIEEDGESYYSYCFDGMKVNVDFGDGKISEMDYIDLCDQYDISIGFENVKNGECTALITFRQYDWNNDAYIDICSTEMQVYGVISGESSLPDIDNIDSIEVTEGDEPWDNEVYIRQDGTYRYNFEDMYLNINFTNGQSEIVNYGWFKSEYGLEDKLEGVVEGECTAKLTIFEYNEMEDSYGKEVCNTTINVNGIKEKEVSSIKVKEAPKSVKAYIGLKDFIVSDGLKVELTYSDGTSEIIEHSDGCFGDPKFDSGGAIKIFTPVITEGDNTITVAYGYYEFGEGPLDYTFNAKCKTTFTLKGEKIKLPKSIKIVDIPQKEVYLNENEGNYYDFNSVKVEITYDDNSKEIRTVYDEDEESYQPKGLNCGIDVRSFGEVELGDNVFTIVYYMRSDDYTDLENEPNVLELTADFHVTGKEAKTIDKLEINTMPQIKTPYVGIDDDDFLNGFSVKVIYDDGTSEIVEADGSYLEVPKAVGGEYDYSLKVTKEGEYEKPLNLSVGENKLRVLFTASDYDWDLDEDVIIPELTREVSFTVNAKEFTQYDQHLDSNDNLDSSISQSGNVILNANNELWYRGENGYGTVKYQKKTGIVKAYDRVYLDENGVATFLDENGEKAASRDNVKDIGEYSALLNDGTLVDVTTNEVIATEVKDWVEYDYTTFIVKENGDAYIKAYDSESENYGEWEKIGGIQNIKSIENVEWYCVLLDENNTLYKWEDSHNTVGKVQDNVDSWMNAFFIKDGETYFTRSGEQVLEKPITAYSSYWYEPEDEWSDCEDGYLIVDSDGNVYKITSVYDDETWTEKVITTLVGQGFDHFIDNGYVTTDGKYYNSIGEETDIIFGDGDSDAVIKTDGYFYYKGKKVLSNVSNFVFGAPIVITRTDGTTWLFDAYTPEGRDRISPPQKLTEELVDSIYGVGTAKVDISTLPVSDIAAVTYNGKEQTPTVTIKDGVKILKAGTDYTVTYANNVNAGTAKVVITGKGGYKGSVEKAFTINKSEQTITATTSYNKIYGDKAFALNAKAQGNLTYKSSNPNIATVDSAGNVTIKGAGEATITINAAETANYKVASKTVQITVNPVSIENAKVTLSTLYWQYTGAQRRPVPKVILAGKTLEAGVDYVLDYDTNKYPGYGYVYIVGKGNYIGEISKTFYISGISLVKAASTGTTTLKLTWTKQSNVTGYKVYKSVSGQYKQIAIVKGAANNSYTVKNLAAGKGYSFKVKAYKKIGTKTYNGVLSPSLSAPTKPTKATLTKLTTGTTHYVKAYWKKKTCTGYQVKIARNSSFTSYDKLYTVKSYKTTSLKMSKLKKGKTYYVKVRAYKTYGGKTVYGSWSTYKKLKCK